MEVTECKLQWDLNANGSELHLQISVTFHFHLLSWQISQLKGAPSNGTL